MAESRETGIPKSALPAFESIVQLTDAFCGQYLNDEYAELARSMAAALARKRPPRLLRGRPATWACGILYAIGQVNFLFEKSQEPYLLVKDLCAAFGVATSTGWAKGREIEYALKISTFDLRWTPKSQLANNPRSSLKMTPDGIVVDVDLPPEMLWKAMRAGLIRLRFDS